MLTTCNRMELYLDAEVPVTAAIRAWLHRWHQVEAGTLDPYLFALEDDQAVHHLLAVTSGMDSMVLGEPQIAGQVKSAWQSARAAGTLGPRLDRLFQHAFQTSKRVRTETGIGENPVTLPFAAIKLAQRIFGPVDRLAALMIGAGEMIEECTRHFAGKGLRSITIANRNAERARALASRFDARSAGLDRLGDLLPEHDLVVASTGAQHALIDAPMVRRALAQRRHRPLFMLDLAVPRNIAPDIAEFEDVYLYTVDDLREIAEQGWQQRSSALGAAEAIVAEQTAAFMRWMNLHAAGETLKVLRKRAFDERDRLLAQARRELEAGRPAEEVLTRLAHRLTNRLLHAPSRRLRAAAELTDQDLMAAARDLLLDEEP